MTARLWTLGSIIVIIALIAGTWFVGISPRLAEAAKANSERESVEMLNAKHSATLATLKQQFEGIEGLKSDLDDARLAVPGTDETADLLRQLHTMARSAEVIITDLTLSSPERYLPLEEPPADPELAAALASVTPDNFLVIPVEQTVAGTYAAVMNYVDSVQLGERAFLVHDLSMEAGLPSGGTEVVVDLTGQIFVLLDGVAAAPVEGETAPPASEEIPQ